MSDQETIDQLKKALEIERSRPIRATVEDRMRWLRVERDATEELTIDRCIRIGNKVRHSGSESNDFKDGFIAGQNAVIAAINALKGEK